jgi:Transcriptional regulator, AbiEi antitoxin, Type IV TA system/Transcriptional regulator, AbiEi antitoxin N-terminal domain
VLYDKPIQGLLRPYNRIPMVAVLRRKLNHLQDILPEQLVVDGAWLLRQGYSRSLRNKYLANGWLEQVSRGVFRRPVARLAGAAETSTQPSWEHVVLSLQLLMNAGVTVGGRSALELQGFAHYLPAAGLREVHLYCSERLPIWFSRVRVDVRWRVHFTDRLFAQGGRHLTHLNAGAKGGGKTSADPIHGRSDLTTLVDPARSRWPLTMSTPERAILEMIDELPLRESFDQVDAIMDGLRSLSPRRLQGLLENCRSIKTKRLFLWFAERHAHAWVKRIDVSRVELGRGKRVLVKDGRLDARYQITVPRSMTETRDGG